MLICFPIHASIDQAQIDTFYLRLYNYEFRSADTALHAIIKNETDQGVIDLLQITYHWWLVISGECNPSGIDPLLEKIDHSIKDIENSSSGQRLNQEKLLQLIVMYSYKSRVHNIQHNRLNSISAYNSSLDYFEQLAPCGKIPCDMYNFVAGMYYSLGGYMKEQYPSLFFLGFDDRYADKQKGYSLLSLGVQSESLQVQTESIYFFMKLYSDVEKKPDLALKYSEMLINKYPDNLVFRFNQIQLLKAQGFDDKVKKELAVLEAHALINQQLTAKQIKHFSEEFKKLDQ